MAFEGEEGIVTVHTIAVVRDPDEPTAGSLHANCDTGGFGVEGVLRQFLDHRGGALDHLTGSNAVGQIL
jgi:hypothetical protein